jgi:small subunit ribosomal protein S20
MAEDQETQNKFPPRVPQAKKRDRRNEKHRLINKSFSSKVRSAVRSFESTLASEETASSRQAALNQVYSVMDRAVKRGIFKLNKAGRLKSRLASRLPQS